ncbi:MAG: glycoside hydrolase family 28 protein [Bacteroidota bacterium]
MKKYFLHAICLLTLICYVGCQSSPEPSVLQQQAKIGWGQQDSILQRIIPPTFPEKIVYASDFGATGDSLFDNHQAINRAIEACHEQGGGKVVVQKGNYLIHGSIVLRSNVNLHLEKGAKLSFGVNPHDYTPLVLSRWEGTMLYNYAPLIQAYQQQNIAITGEGIIEGNTQAGWAAWKRGNGGNNQKADKKRLRQKGNDSIPVAQRVFGNGYLDLNGDGKDDGFGDEKPHFLRPSLIEFLECENILLEGFTTQNPPFWSIHPIFCRNVTIQNLNILNGTTNDDGIDPDGSQDVLIRNCQIHTDDDPIAIKAGRDQDAWDKMPSRNIIVRNCTVSSVVGNAFCIGSEMSAGVSHVFVENYTVTKTKHGINFKCNLDRGGFIREVFIREVTIDTATKAAVVFQMDYKGWRGNHYPTEIQRIYLQDVDVEWGGKAPIRMAGVSEKPISKVLLENVQITSAEEAPDLQFVEQIETKRVSINRQSFLWEE